MLFTDFLTLTSSRSFTISEREPKDKKKDKKANDIHRQIVYKASNGVEISKDQLSQMSIFQKKQVNKLIVYLILSKPYIYGLIDFNSCFGLF